MRIQVKSLQGDQYMVEVQNDQTIYDVKSFISKQADHIPIERQKLVFKGRTLQDASLVGECNLEEGCKVHLILQKESVINKPVFDAPQASKPSSSYDSSSSNSYGDSNNQPTAVSSNTKASNSTTSTSIPQSRLEMILRERLAKHFDPDAVEKIMVNLQNEINADSSSNSFDDLERLAQQKLNISNE